MKCFTIYLKVGIQKRRRRKLKKHNCWCMSFYSIFFLSFLFNDIFNLTWCYEKAWPFCQRKKIWNDNDVLGPKRKLLAMTSIYWFDNFLNILNNYYQRFRVENLWFIMLLPATLLLERDWKRQRLKLISLNIVYIS